MIEVEYQEWRDEVKTKNLEAENNSFSPEAQSKEESYDVTSSRPFSTSGRNRLTSICIDRHQSSNPMH
jgi:hypothetical protein